MDWVDEVQGKLKRKNQILFSKDSELLQELDVLIQQQSHRVIVLWALELAEDTVCLLAQKYPNDVRPRNALESAKLWALGTVKMPLAKRDILNCHAMAKELTSPEDIALCHAVGQACSVVHTSSHALGYPIYELTALVRRWGINNCREAVERRVHEYVEHLLYWTENAATDNQPWAPFLRDR